MQIDAPILVFTCFEAHLPNAAEPPALLMRATIMPSNTRNIKIPALPETAEIKPSVVILSIAWMGLKFLTDKRPPTKIPTKSEEYTSLVIRASPIAIIGGKSDQSVPTGLVIEPVKLP